MEEIYVVYLYCDYRKQVDIQHLKSFKSKNSAIEFAKKYTNDKENENHQRYVSIKGTEYDAELFYHHDDNENYIYTDEEIEKRKNIQKEVYEELQIKRHMWYIRIAVDKVSLE